MHLSISNDIVSTKIIINFDFDFEIVNFPFLDGDVPRSTSYGVYILCFVRASSHVADLNTRNKLLTQDLLKKGYLYHKLRKNFSKGALSWYGKLTWESAHAWNLIILCLLIVCGMTFIFMVHLTFYAIPLLIYDVMYDITTIPWGIQLKSFLK